MPWDSFPGHFFEWLIRYLFFLLTIIKNKITLATIDSTTTIQKDGGSGAKSIQN